MIAPFIIYGPDYSDDFEYVENHRGQCVAFVVVSKKVFLIDIYNQWSVNSTVDSDPCFYSDVDGMIIIKTITRETIADAINYLHRNTSFFSRIRSYTKKELLDLESSWLAHSSGIAFSSCFPSEDVWEELLEAGDNSHC